jgi:uncharacterized protein (TIGR00159 family)
MDKLVNVGVIILVVLFQDDVRIFLSELGSHKSWKRFTNFFKTKKTNEEDVPEYIMHIVYACKNMSQSKTGALIVIKQDMSLNKYLTTGERINADINSQLIETIFYKGTPLHDGAMIISKDRIVAAGCILPVSHSFNIPKALGLRHRAALGMSERSDALCVVISEETGRISVTKNGELKLNISPEELEKELSSYSM